MVSVIPPLEAFFHSCPMPSRMWKGEEPRGISVARRMRCWARDACGVNSPIMAAARARRPVFRRTAPEPMTRSLFLFFIVLTPIAFRLRAQEQLAFARQEPTRSPLHDQIAQAPLRSKIRIHCQGLLEQQFKFRLVLLLNRDGLRIGHVGPG